MYPTCTEIWEPFCGGGAVTLALSKAGFKVHASDIHHDLIMMWRAVMAGDEGVYADVTEEEYNALKNAPSSARRGFVGFGASFGGSWFGGYGRRESCGAQEDLEEIKGWHCPTCGGGKHETHDPIDRLIAEYMTPAPQAQAKLDEKTIKAQMLAWFRTEPSEYTSEVYLPAN
jgi:hypothetical protein